MLSYTLKSNCFINESVLKIRGYKDDITNVVDEYRDKVENISLIYSEPKYCYDIETGKSYLVESGYLYGVDLIDDVKKIDDIRKKLFENNKS